MALGGALRSVFAIFGVQVDPEGNLKKGHREVSSLKTAFEGAVAAFAGNALVGATRSLAHTMEGIRDVSAITGVATDEVQTLGFAYEMAGGSAEEMNAALIMMQRSLKGTADASGPQVDAMKALGIATKDAAGQPRALNDVLPEVFANFAKLGSSAKEAEVASSLFGRQGIRMLPVLRQGAAGLAQMRKELDELGGPVPAQAIEDADAMQDAFGKFDRALFNLKATIGAQVFPQLEKLVSGVAKGIGRVVEFARGTTLAQSGALAMGVAIAGPLMSALGPLLKPGLKFAAIFLAMDDAIAFLQGKDSVIGAILNGFFGPETTAGVRAWINGVVGSFSEVLKSGTSIFTALSNGWETTLLDMTIAIDEWILGIGTKWNDLVGSLGLDALKVDDKSSILVNEEGLADRRKRRDDLQIEAYERQNKIGKFGAPEEFGIRAEAPFQKGDAAAAFAPPPASPLQRARADAASAQAANDPQAMFRAMRAAEDAKKAERGQSYREAFLGPVPGIAQAIPLPGAAPQKIETHIDARTTVNATTNADPKDIADAVANKQKESMRNAYTSITARSSAAAR